MGRNVAAILLLAMMVMAGQASARSLCSTVTKTTSASCPSTALATDQCFTLQITGCPNGLDISGASSAVTSTTSLVKVTGTGTSGILKICKAGGDGGGMCESAFVGAFTNTVLTNVVSRGGRVAQIQWGFAGDKVFAGNAGIIAHLARAATITNWLATTANGVHAAGMPVVNYGQSGGCQQVAGEIGFYDGDNDVDMAICSSGPPMARVDAICGGNIIVDWAAWWPAHSNPSSVGKCGGECGILDSAYGVGSTVCTAASMTGGSGNPGRRDSLTRPDVKKSYPRLDLVQVLGSGTGGSGDTSAAYPNGQWWWANVALSAKTRTQTLITQVGGHNHTDVPNDSATYLDTLLQTVTCNRAGCP